MKVRGYREIVEAEIVTLPSYWGDGLLVPGGSSVLYGPTGYYKSFLIQQLLLSLGTAGGTFLGQPIHHPAKTLYVEMEITEKRFQTRLQQMGEAIGAPPDDMVYYAHPISFRLASTTQAQELYDAVKACDADIVVIDPLNRTLSGSENRDDHVSNYVDMLDWVKMKRLKDDGKLLCVGFVHHANKGMYNDFGEYVARGLADASGTKNITAWPDTVLRIVPMGYRRIEVRFEKVRHAEETPFPVWMRMEKGVLVQDEQDPQTVLHSLLQDGPMPITKLKTAIGETCKVSRRLRDELVETMTAKGVVEIYANPTKRTEKLVKLLGGD